MIYLLDTNIVSMALRDASSSAATRMANHRPSELVIPSIVRAELTFGAVKGGSATRIHNLRTFLAQFPNLDFDSSCLDIYSTTRHTLERAGQGIGAMDLLIASIALAHKLIIVTNNTSEFSRIAGLHLEDWRI